LLASLTASCAASSTLVVPLTWAVPEGRLTISVSLLIADTGAWQDSVTRIDFGNLNGFMLPTDKCSNCGKSCAPKGLLMPHDKCPGGGVPGTKVYEAKDRKYVNCPASDVALQIGGKQFNISGSDLGSVMYMTTTSRCSESEPANTGFSGNSPFLQSLYSQLGSHIFTLAVRKPNLSFGVSDINTNSSAVTTPWIRFGGHAGRAVQIIAINGAKLESTLTSTIDTGNSAFLTYGPGSPLSAAKKFPFSVTFEGGGTLTFTSAPTVRGETTRVLPYTHNVLALGFLAPYDFVVDDAKKTVTFQEP